MNSTAEPIAELLSDISKGHIRRVRGAEALDNLTQQVRDFRKLEPPPVIDATEVYEYVSTHTIRPYEDHDDITMPWPAAFFGYVNEHGNSNVVFAVAVGPDTETFGPAAAVARHQFSNGRHAHANSANALAGDIDWDAVSGRIIAWLYVGGRNRLGEPVATTGPLYAWSILLDAQGAPLDIVWYDPDIEAPTTIESDTAPSTDADRYGAEKTIDHTNKLLVLLRSLSALNAVNVDIEVPDRPRPVRRRLERLGTEVNVIHIYPPGPKPKGGYKRGSGEPLLAADIGSDVRGHWAHYGPKYGKGLLFGKYEGKFRIPRHVRSGRTGRVREHDYVIHEEKP